MKRFVLAVVFAGLFCVTVQAQQSTQSIAQDQPLNTEPLRSDTALTSGLEQTQPVAKSKVNIRNGVLEIEDTIRIKREQPKVLSIVPWQPPRDKASLPSPFVKRIEQDFMPLDREEFTRKVQHFERVSGSEQK